MVPFAPTRSGFSAAECCGSWLCRAADAGYLADTRWVLGMQLSSRSRGELIQDANTFLGDGGADGSYGVAQCYVHGLGVEPDLERARQWLRRAADEGHPRASAELRDLE